MSSMCVMWHDRPEERFVAERCVQENRSGGETYYTLRLGNDLSAFLSPERLRELGAVIEAALAAEEPPVLGVLADARRLAAAESTGRADSAAEPFHRGRNLLAETEAQA